MTIAPSHATAGTQATRTFRVRQAIAAKPAPAEIPKINGSAKLFRSIPCSSAPAVPRAAPTVSAAMTLGKRKSQKMVWGRVSPCRSRACHNSARLRDTEPRLRAIPTVRTIIIASNTTARSSGDWRSGRRSLLGSVMGGDLREVRGIGAEDRVGILA